MLVTTRLQYRHVALSELIVNSKSLEAGAHIEMRELRRSCSAGSTWFLDSRLRCCPFP